MVRTRTCVCGEVFEFEEIKGKYRKYCSPECKQEASRKRRTELNVPLKKCSTPWCEKLANRKGLGLCEGCYMRMRRKGTTDYRPPASYRTAQSAGYVWVREPGHPLADSGGLVYEHRFVYYSHYGEGPFKCHWCGKQATWSDMHIDHLDDDKTNNSIGNLVASCPLCNQKRGRWKAIATARKHGVQITYNGVTKTALLWANDLGLSRSAFNWRMEHWPIETAMSKPHGPTGPKNRAKTKQEEKERQ